MTEPRLTLLTRFRLWWWYVRLRWALRRSGYHPHVIEGMIRGGAWEEYYLEGYSPRAAIREDESHL